jgi:uncharacterized membrane protein YoaK (UPF0700 family)
MCAGSMDAISYLGLERVFTAMMTGNIVLLGLAAGRVEGLSVLRSVSAFAGFSLGVALASRLLRPSEDHVLWPRPATIALGAELAVLAAFGLAWQLVGAQPPEPLVPPLIAVAGCAMGIQSATALYVSTAGVKAGASGLPYVTGVVVSLVMELVNRTERPLDWLRRAGGVVGMVLGAALGAILITAVPRAAPLAPVCILALVVTAAAILFGRRT